MSNHGTSVSGRVRPSDGVVPWHKGVDFAAQPAVGDTLKRESKPASGSTLFFFAVCNSVAMVAQVRLPPSLPANRLFFLVIVCGLMARSTMLESSSMRPSVRKRSKMAHLASRR